MLKKRKDFATFKADIESIVIRGNLYSDIQYVLEMNCGAGNLCDLFACYLVSRFGKRGTALTARNIFMADNKEVMARWARLSDEGMTRLDANEHLRKYYDPL